MFKSFNKDYVFLKLNIMVNLKIINQLIDENISLKLINDQWFIKSIVVMDQLTFKFPFFKKIL